MPKARKTAKPAKSTRKAPKAKTATRAKPVPATKKIVVPKTPSPQRLGDGLSDAPKLSREPVTLIVARTDVVAGGVRIKSTGPTALRVAKG
ncbi:MAG: hypothetical protein WC876_12080, partial [Candidatus Thermoplasmatota archaeon]